MKRIFIALLLCAAAFTCASAQNLKGTVYYRSTKGGQEALPYAQVYYLEGSQLIECDENGVFNLKIKKEATLIGTYVGYTQDTVRVTPDMTEVSFYLTGDNEVEEAVITARQAGLSRLNPIKTEVITAAGLCKMACCNLAESFENSASVAVGYSDAVTGARQIKLLGLSGTYTQMLDENRPVMRGLASPFGMSYVPGQWLESIQIAKGPSSVVNGYESITGQINMEHRKPTDETPLFINLYGSTDYMFEGNIVSALQLNQKWSTILMGHYSGTEKSMDHNGDGFRDDPLDHNFSFGNRWLYYSPRFQFRFGVKALHDDRLGGEMKSTRGADYTTSSTWASNIINKGINGYMKAGYAMRDDQSESIAVVLDYNWYGTDSYFGRREFNGSQSSFFANLLYQNQLNEYHSVEFGGSALLDDYTQTLIQNNENFKLPTKENIFGAFGEYTYKNDEKVTIVAGARFDYNNRYGCLFAPRLTFKYSLTDNLILRLSGGKGFHTPYLITDNLGIMSTGRNISRETFLKDYNLERAWTYGGNFTVYLPFGYENNSYISVEYFRSDFLEQLIVDQEVDGTNIWAYNLTDLDNGKSYTNTYQADFSTDITENLNLVATFRYTDAKVSLKGQGLVERPMTSRYKAVLNAQYKTNLSKWIFDFTAQLNGPMRLPNFAAEAFGMEHSPVYPMLYFQVTRKFRGLDIYAGGENLTNYRQHHAIIGAENPFDASFNASTVWGPLMGAKFYVGLRYTLWK